MMIETERPYDPVIPADPDEDLYGFVYYFDRSRPDYGDDPIGTEDQPMWPALALIIGLGALIIAILLDPLVVAGIIASTLIGFHVGGWFIAQRFDWWNHPIWRD